MTTRDDVIRHRRSGPWRALQQTAHVIVADAQRMAGGSPLQARLGGGTRLMLALEHRISDDIDLFIRDPQWLGYLSPRLNERVEAMTRDLFDWWAIETLKPGLAPEADLGRLLKSRQVDLRAALSAIARSARADTLWSQIRAADKPDLASTAAWAQARLADYERSAV